MRPRTNSVILSIQYLRALAATSVVWLHALYVVPGVADRFGAPFLGSSGVDLFFVISGFIMVVTTARTEATPASFLGLRIIRVVPLYWLATLAMVVLEASDHASAAYRDTPGAILKSLLFVPYSAPESPRGTPIVEIGWTLNYEMFFYVLFALSLAAPRRGRLPGMLVTLGSLAVIGRWFGPFSNPMASVYTSPLLLEFAAGMMMAHAWLHEGSRNWLPLPLPLPLLVFGLYCLGAMHSRWVVMGGAFIIVAACLHPRIRSLRARPLLELGNASYAIYLVHQFVLDALAPRWIRRVPHATWGSSALFMLAALTLCVAAGWLCYRLVERPITSYLRSWVRKYAPVSESSPST
jgi:exopolysaccharide production protein ExoZ